MCAHVYVVGPLIPVSCLILFSFFFLFPSSLYAVAPFSNGALQKKKAIFDVLKTSSKKPRQNFLTWQKLKRQKS
jgi:hypothetical protein